MKEKIIGLLESNDPANHKIGLELAQSQDIDITDYLEEIRSKLNDSLYREAKLEDMPIATWVRIYYNWKDVMSIKSSVIKIFAHTDLSHQYDLAIAIAQTVKNKGL